MIENPENVNRNRRDSFEFHSDEHVSAAFTYIRRHTITFDTINVSHDVYMSIVIIIIAFGVGQVQITSWKLIIVSSFSVIIVDHARSTDISCR